MGAGKSTVGRHLARRLGWKFIDLDQEIERREHRDIADIFKKDGEPYFRNLERLCLQDLSSSRKAVIAMGGGAFIDAGNRELAKNTGVTVWLKASFSNLVDRVKMDGTRPKFLDKAQAERLYQTREPVYAQAKVHVETDGGTPDSVVDEIIGELRKL